MSDVVTRILRLGDTSETIIASALVAGMVLLGFGNATVGIVTIGLMNVVNLPALLESCKEDCEVNE